MASLQELKLACVALSSSQWCLPKQEVEYTAGLVSDAVAPDRCAMEFRKTIAAVRRGFSTSAMTVMHLAVLMSSPHLLRHTLSMSTNAQCMMQKMWG